MLIKSSSSGTNCSHVDSDKNECKEVLLGFTHNLKYKQNNLELPLQYQNRPFWNPGIFPPFRRKVLKEFEIAIIHETLRLIGIG